MNWNMIEDEWVESKIKTKRNLNKFNDDEMDYGKNNKKYDVQKHYLTQRNSKNKSDKHFNNTQNVLSISPIAVNYYKQNSNVGSALEREKVRSNDKANSYVSHSISNQFNKKRV